MKDWQQIQLIRIQNRLRRAHEKAEEVKEAAGGYPEAYGTLAGAIEDVLVELEVVLGNIEATATTVAE